MFRGIKTSQGIQTAKLKSLPNVNIWVLDEAEELVDEEIFDKINLSVRKKGTINLVIMITNPTYKNHFIYKRFFETPGVPDDFNGTKGNTSYIFMTYKDNEENIDPILLRELQQLEREFPQLFKKRMCSSWLDENEIGKIPLNKFFPYSMYDLEAKAVNEDVDLVWDFVLDSAYTRDKKNSASSIMCFARAFNRVYFRAFSNVHLEFPQLIDHIKSFCIANGYSDKSRIWVEPKASGKSVVQTIREETKLNIIEDDPPKGKTKKDPEHKTAKEIRNDSNLPFMEAERVRLLEGYNWEVFKEQCRYFPDFEFMDLVDCLNMAIDKAKNPQEENSLIDIAII